MKKKKKIMKIISFFALLLFFITIVAVVGVVHAFPTSSKLAVKPQKGWSTWCALGNCGRDVCTDAELRKAAMKLKSSGLFDLGYDKIWVDDCWEADYRLPNGTITWDPQRFPYGMPALIDFLNSQKIGLGLYLSCGNVTCSSGGRPKPVPGSEGRYQEDVNTLSGWGVWGIKADWCGDVHKLPIDGIAVGAKDYKNFSHAIQNAVPNNQIYFQGVAAILFLWSEVGNYVNDFRSGVDHHDSWRNLVEDILLPATKLEIGSNSALEVWQDLDILMTGGQGCKNQTSISGDNTTAHCPGMTDTEYISEFTLWAILQSPLFVGTDILDLTPIMQRILFNKQLLSIHYDTRTPPGKFIGGDRTNCKFLGKELCQYWLRQLADGSVFLVLFNLNDNDQLIQFNFGDQLKFLPASWSANTTASVQDLWADSSKKHVRSPAEIHFDDGQMSVTGMFSATVDAHGVAAVVLTPEN